MPVSRRAEIGLLVVLCFVLPLYEAPKNIAWLAYALVWLWNRAKARDFGGRWDLWDTLIAAWIPSGFVVAAFAALHGSEWRGAFDIVRYAGVMWMVKRSRLTAGETQWVLGALVAAVLVGLAMAYAELWSGTSAALQLNSVGHVNHSAIYLAIMLGVCTSWFFAGPRRVLAIAVGLLALVSLFVMASRAGVAAGILAICVLGAAWWRRSRWPLGIAAVLVAVSGLIAVSGGAEVMQKQEERMQSGNVLAYREIAWRVALDSWRDHPWFGIGMDNFKLLMRARDASGKGDLLPHAHSLYLNTLAERGIVGSAPLAAVLVAWPLWLVRRRPRTEASAQEWVLWGAATSAWIVTAVVGAVNTTLHHEHALLATLLLGLWLGRVDRR